MKVFRSNNLPKLAKDFDTTLNFGVELELKQNLVAMGYLTQRKGEYASPARNLLWQAFKRWREGLSERDRKDFDKILANVKITITK
jgi:hypothetical protein